MKLASSPATVEPHLWVRQKSAVEGDREAITCSCPQVRAALLCHQWTCVPLASIGVGDGGWQGNLATRDKFGVESWSYHFLICRIYVMAQRWILPPPQEVGNWATG